jgi:hypothetical protein
VNKGCFCSELESGGPAPFWNIEDGDEAAAGPLLIFVGLAAAPEVELDIDVTGPGPEPGKSDDTLDGDENRDVGALLTSVAFAVAGSLAAVSGSFTRIGFVCCESTGTDASTAVAGRFTTVISAFDVFVGELETAAGGAASPRTARVLRTISLQYITL